MKINIVDLMNHYYGEDYVDLNLQSTPFPHKNRFNKSFTKKNHVLKSSGLIAACFLCVFSIAIALALPLWAQSSTFGANAQNESYSIENQENIDNETVCILSSNQTDAVLAVSKEHIDDFQVDEPYSVTIDEHTYNFETTIYSYYDSTQQSYGYDGIIWKIVVSPISELEQFYELEQDELCYMINVRFLGYDENYIYKLVCLGMLFEEDHQYDAENLTSIQSYCEHMVYGIDVLEDFIVRNELQRLERAIDWKAWYTREIMAPIEARMAKKSD